MSSKEMEKVLQQISLELAKIGVDVLKEMRAEQWQAYLQKLWEQGTFQGAATGVYEAFQNPYFMQKLAEEVKHGDKIEKILDVLKKILEKVH